MNENWQSRLNRVFMGRFEFLSSLKQDPRLINVGRYTIPGELVEAEHRHRSMLRRPGAYNETQAIIAGVPNFSGDPAVLWYRSLDYSVVLAMREMVGRAPIISVSTLPVCPNLRKIFVQRRSPDSDLQPSRFHTFSGAYQTGETGISHEGDGESLTKAAFRELAEETGLSMEHASDARLALFNDKISGAIEFCVLGVSVRAAEVECMQDTEEGEVVSIDFDELGTSLQNADCNWAPGGQSEIMAWLAFGAPPMPTGVKFGRQTAKELFLSLTAV